MPKSRPLLPGEAPQEERLQMAIQAYKAYEERYNATPEAERKNMKKPSYRECALTYGIDHGTTLSRRIKNKTRDRHAAHVHQQVLTPQEEKALVALAKVLLTTEVLKLGERLRYSQLHALGTELLRQRTSEGELGKGWIYKFLERHPDLKDVFERQTLEKANSKFNVRPMEGTGSAPTGYRNEASGFSPAVRPNGIPGSASLERPMETSSSIPSGTSHGEISHT